MSNKKPILSPGNQLGKRSALAAGLSLFLILALVTVASARTIVVDGVNTNNEWNGINAVASDGNEVDILDNIDIANVYVTSDETNIYIRIDTHSMPPSTEGEQWYAIYFDTDDSAGTGQPRHDVGAETRLRIYPYRNRWVCDVEHWDGSMWVYYSEANFSLNDVLEVSTSLADLDLEICTTYPMVFYADGGTSDSDEVPNSGHVTYHPPPTDVQLASFTAAWQGQEVLVHWETVMELNTAGFNVWSSTTADGVYTEVNAALIPAALPGGNEGNSYSLTDSTAAPGTAVYYKLEELVLGGGSNWHGPAVATPYAVKMLLPARPRPVLAPSLPAGRPLPLPVEPED